MRDRSCFKLKKQFNAIRREDFPWSWEVTKNASDQPFFDLGKAFRAFFEGLKNGKRKGRPRFKSKKRSEPSFYLANDQCVLGDHRIWIPKLGWVNMAENLRFKGKATGARITKTADWWFVSIQVDLPDAIPVKRPAAVGIDVGLNRVATLPYGRGIRKPSIPANGTQEAAPGRAFGCVDGSKAQKIVKKRVDRCHDCITALRACVMMSCTN